MVRDHERDTDDIALDERVWSLLSAAAAPSEPGPLPGEGVALAAYRAAQPESRRSPHRPVLAAARSGVAAAMAGLLLTGGVAAATAGVLPGVAQGTVDGVLVDLGLSPRTDRATLDDATREDTSETAVPSVPGDSEGADGTGLDEAAAGTRGQSGEAAGAAPGHGDEVSRTARDTEASGADKGAEISDLASRGRSRAGGERPESDRSTRTRPTGASVSARVRAERAAAARVTGSTGRDAGAGRP